MSRLDSTSTPRALSLHEIYIHLYPRGRGTDASPSSLSHCKYLTRLGPHVSDCEESGFLAVVVSTHSSRFSYFVRVHEQPRREKEKLYSETTGLAYSCFSNCEMSYR